MTERPVADVVQQCRETNNAFIFLWNAFKSFEVVV